MNPKTVGITILKLRKRKNMTQSELAEFLSVSNKTVSKWENGTGFPDITVLPALARVLGVSVDYILNDGTSGIAVAGNITFENINIVNKIPTCENPSEIIETINDAGGAVSLISINLSRIDRAVPVIPIGKIGDDRNGNEIINILSSHGIYTGKISKDYSLKTSYSVVNFGVENQERSYSFFYEANDAFDTDDFSVDELNCKIFHVGYVPMMKALDSPDKLYGTKLAGVLRQASLSGIRTGISVATRSDPVYFRKIFPVLKYTDYVIMDEYECCKIGGGIARGRDNLLKTDVIKMSMKKFFEYGVREKVIVQSSEEAFLMNSDGSFSSCKAYIPEKWNIKSTLGRREAFAAGCLYSLYCGYGDSELLKFSLMASAYSMTEYDALSGMKSADEIKSGIIKNAKMKMKGESNEQTI